MSFLKFATASVVLTAAAASQAAIVINEIDYDNVGTDTGEFIELYNPDSSAQSLTGFSLVLFNGSTTANTAYRTIALTGSIPAGGYFTIGTLAGSNILGTSLTPSASQDLIQNGSPDSLGIYTGTAPTSATATNLVAGTGITYEGTNATTPVEFLLAAPTAAEFDLNSINASLSRIPNGTGAFALTGTPTPGAANVLAAIPEPTSVAALALGGLFLRRRRA